jgi:hypothetical protein
MTPEQIEVLSECLAALTGVLDDNGLSIERTAQVAEAQAKLRVIVAYDDKPSRLTRFSNRLFPVHTHCVKCKRELPGPSKVGTCWECMR